MLSWIATHSSGPKKAAMRMNENPKKDQNSLRVALPLSLKEIAFLKFEKEKLIYIVSVFCYTQKCTL